MPKHNKKFYYNLTNSQSLYNRQIVENTVTFCLYEITDTKKNQLLIL